MAFCFDENKVINMILFMLQCLGGKAPVQRLFLLIYLADVRHLVQHGSLISGDTYVAMKHGPVPLQMLGMYRRLRQHPLAKQHHGRVRMLMQAQGEDCVEAQHAYDGSCLAETEVACLFEAVHACKDKPTEVLQELVRQMAWNAADATGEINLLNMAMENGATPEMIRYIEMSFNDEIHSFRKS